MSIPNKTTAHTNSDIAFQAIADAANAKFIAETEVVIATAIALGKFEVNLICPINTDPKYIQTYFNNLGYTTGFPDSLTINGQPAQMFGTGWDMFWTNNGIPMLTSPTRVVISWLLANP